VTHTPVHPARLSFTYSEAEYWNVRVLDQRRYDHGPSWDTFWFLIVIYEFGTGLMVLAAYGMGLIDEGALRAVLATAYVASIASVIATYALLRLRSRQLSRQTFDQAGRGLSTWELAFDADGIVCYTELIETRARWTSVSAVEDWGPIVAIRLQRPYVVHIPTRVFADDAERKAFIAAVKANIAATAVAA
jgi:hypothetical protein